MTKTNDQMTKERIRRALIADAMKMSKFVASGAADDGAMYDRLAVGLAEAQHEIDHIQIKSDGIIDDIMAALDVRHAYPFQSRLSSDPDAEPTYGVDTFLADVKLAAAASRGKEAAGRLAAARRATK